MGEFEHDELRQRYALVIEGHCPNDHGELERRDECGWCTECGMGWSVRGKNVTVHFAGGSYAPDTATLAHKPWLNRALSTRFD